MKRSYNGWALIDKNYKLLSVDVKKDKVHLIRQMFYPHTLCAEVRVKIVDKGVVK